MMNRFSFRHLYPLIVIGGLVLLTAGGCELIASVDRSLIPGEGGTSATGGMGGASTTSTTGGGGTGGGTCNPALCPGDTDCVNAICDANDMCSTQNETQGAMCTDTADPNAQVCDGMGACVECNGDGDCTAPDTCDVPGGNICVPPTCSNGVIDNGETDVDCGNNAASGCGTCANALNCDVFGDCTSGFCDTSSGGGGSGGNATAGICMACANDGNCQATDYCNSGVCTTRIVLGQPCTANNQCVTPMQCIDGVCCDGACAGTCESCTAALTGGVDGTCSGDLAADPNNECTSSATNCETGMCHGTLAQCEADTSTTRVCRAQNGVCDIADTCDGTNPTCPVADAVEPNTTSCAADTDGGGCDAEDFCDGVTKGCTDTFEGNTFVCLAGTGPCDPDDVCNGVNTTCAPVFIGQCVTATGCDTTMACDGAGACLLDTGQTPCTLGTECCSGTCTATVCQ